jgi:aspartyl-tRNA(Asn)/glutamyl-tRNA(Gln) amidotransferase subunit B
MNDYKTTIGIEVHAELKSNTKMFSSSKNDFKTRPNSNISVIDLGYPGTLPLVNKGAVELALKAALLLNCKINKRMHFDRKNYFYPDLPKGYQITQARTPIGVDGYVEIEVDGVTKKIGIHDIHIEEDTAKSIHNETTSYLDFNRAGVPLIEIVTYPDMNSKEEAMAYLERLREILLYAEVSDCKMEEGSMRCDVNVSVSKNDILGVRTETKNIGSISSVGMAINSESLRQIKVLEDGGSIREETRRYDEASDQTILMRVKETGNDYRYFPEPDIPFIELSDEYINKIHDNLPVMPNVLRKKYKELNINDNNIKTIIANKDLCKYFESFVNDTNPVTASNLLTGDIMGYLNKNNLSINDINLDISNLKKLIKVIDDKKISSKQAKQLIPVMLETGKDVDVIINEMGMVQISDDKVLQELVDKVISANQESVNDYKAGKDRALKYLMGQIMKESKGKANPSEVNRLLVDTLRSI